MPRHRQRIRYAVVGQGWISQVAVLPAFEHAASNSELCALISGDPVKLESLGKRYGIRHRWSYEQYDECLQSGEIDAIYLAAPNSLHREYAVRAARAGVHVLCEKPMAVTEQECEEMIHAADEGGVKIMISYRLHFEEANLRAIEIAQSGELGDLRVFSSVFCQQVPSGNVRLKKDLGGGPLYDIGIYCINAARYIFQEEPHEVTGRIMKGNDERFRETPEAVSAILRFPSERVASFTCSFGAASVNRYEVLGTKGRLEVDPAFEFQTELKHRLTANGHMREEMFARRDQFAPVIMYFSRCILADEDPEPCGWEGLADVRIIRAIRQSAETGRPVKLGPFHRKQRPGIEQEIQAPPVSEPELVHAREPVV